MPQNVSPVQKIKKLVLTCSRLGKQGAAEEGQIGGTVEHAAR